jgi:hypothetical protein
MMAYLNAETFYLFLVSVFQNLLRLTGHYWLSGSMLFGNQLDDPYSVTISQDRAVCH